MATLIDYATRWWEIVWVGQCGSCRIVVLAVPMAIALALTAHVVLDRARSSVWRWTMVGMASGASLFTLAALTSRVESVRALGLLIGDLWPPGTIQQCAWLLLFLFALIELVGIVGLALVRLSRLPGTTAGGLYGLAILGLVPSALWLRQLLTAIHMPAVSCLCLENSSPYARWRLLADAITQVDAIVAHAPLVLGLAGLLALGLTLRPPKKERRGRPSLAIGAVVALLGAGAFAATRGHAFDRRHPESIAGMRWDWTEQTHHLLPRAPTRACREPEPLPTLEIDREDARLDHRRVNGPLLQQDLETLRRNWEVLYPWRPWPGALRVRILRDASAAHVLPYLSRAFRAGYGSVHIDTSYPERFETGTRGSITRWRLCSVPAELVVGESSASDAQALIADALDGTIEVPQIP